MLFNLPNLGRSNATFARMPRPTLIKPPCPRCGTQTFSLWTCLVGLACVVFFPAGAALMLCKPTYRCWSCGCKFKSTRPSEMLVPVPVAKG
jgi:hypothetical protein